MALLLVPAGKQAVKDTNIHSFKIINIIIIIINFIYYFFPNGEHQGLITHNQMPTSSSNVLPANCSVYYRLDKACQMPNINLTV